MIYNASPKAKAMPSPIEVKGRDGCRTVTIVLGRVRSERLVPYSFCLACGCVTCATWRDSHIL